MSTLRVLAAVVAAVTLDAAARCEWVPTPTLALARELQADVESALWQPTYDTTQPSTFRIVAAKATAESVQGSSGTATQFGGVLPDTTPSRMGKDGEVEAATSQRTYMKCLGTTSLTRACHLQNVYYDLETKHFIYYGPIAVSAKSFGATVKTGDPWLRLIRDKQNAWRHKHKNEQFILDWRGGEPLPPAGRIAAFEQPLHLRAPFHTRSFGHLLRDNLLPQIDLPMRFGRDPVDFDWVRWTSTMTWTDWEEESHVAEHYRGLVNNRPSWTWPQVLEAALEGQPSRSDIRFIRFSEIIAGQGPVDMLAHAGAEGADRPRQMAIWAHMCDPFPFTAMREVAYRNHGLQVASVADLEPLVLFMNGRQGEKRYYLNADATIAKLQDRFPGVRMQHVPISKYPLQEQLEYISKATVIVTSIGSRSFRLIYGANGATTILVGPPEYPWMTEPGRRGAKPTQEQVAAPFFEIDNCWGYIGYVNLLQYHVTSEAEVEKVKPWNRWQDARNSNIILDADKLEGLLRVALQQGGDRAHEYRRPYTGAGTLAAYAT